MPSRNVHLGRNLGAPGQAWEIGMRWNTSEISHWNPAGTQSRPAKCADSRNRVLRGGGATHTAKRTQGVCRLCD
jgi:hypothetical protein